MEAKEKAVKKSACPRELGRRSEVNLSINVDSLWNDTKKTFLFYRKKPYEARRCQNGSD